MEELVKLVAKKTGLNDAMARVAINVVLDFIKKKLPAPIGAQVGNFLENESSVAAAGSAIEGLISAASKSKKK